MAVFLKHDVKRAWLDPMPKVIQVLAKLYDRYSEDLMITSGTEGAHIRKSLHYIGHAVDFRPGSRSKGDVMTALRNAGFEERDFDLVDGYATGHWHLEYDPKDQNWGTKQDQLMDAWLKSVMDDIYLEEYKQLRQEWIDLGELRERSVKHHGKEKG